MRYGIRSCARLTPMCTIVFFLLLGSAFAQQQVTFQGQYYGVNPVDVVTGDMNGDGRPDVISADGQFGTVNVLLNNGDGTFQDPGRVFNVGTNPCAVAVADFNFDGRLDVAAADCGGSSISVLFGTGDGNLVNRLVLPVNGTPDSITIADFNGDHRPDIAVALSNSPRISIYFSFSVRGQTIFTQPQNITVSTGGTTSLKSITSGDINGDGRPDLAVLACCGTGVAPVSVFRLDNQTIPQSFDARFVPRFVESGTALSVKLADIDKDGFADFLLPYYTDPACNGSNCQSIQGVTYIFNNPNGTTTKNGYVVSPDAFYFIRSGVAAADVNGDGLNDLAFSVQGNRFETGDSVRYLLATGPRTFAPADFVSVGGREGVEALASADFNRDGLADVVTANVTHEKADVLLSQRTNAVSENGVCAAPTSPGIRICSPVPGVNAGNGSTYFQASASAGQGQTVQAMRLYVDNQPQYTTDDPSLITVENLPSGAHKAVVVAYTTAGTFTSNTLIAACVPPPGGIQICSPAANATVSSPVSITATTVATTGANIAAIRLYVDGRPIVTRFNSPVQTIQQIMESIPIASGSHFVTVVGYQTDGTPHVAQIRLNVR